MRKIVYPRAGGVETIEIVEDSDPIPRSDQVCVRIHPSATKWNFDAQPSASQLTCRGVNSSLGAVGRGSLGRLVPR